MTPMNPGQLTTRMRRFVMPATIDRHVHHTHQMLIASSVAAMIIVGLAAALIGAVL